MKSPNVEFVTEAFSGDVVDALPTRRGIGELLAPKSTKRYAGSQPEQVPGTFSQERTGGYRSHGAGGRASYPNGSSWQRILPQNSPGLR